MNPFLYFSQDDLRSMLGTIYGRGSFAVRMWDHLRYCTVLGGCKRTEAKVSARGRC